MSASTATAVMLKDRRLRREQQMCALPEAPSRRIEASGWWFLVCSGCGVAGAISRKWMEPGDLWREGDVMDLRGEVIKAGRPVPQCVCDPEATHPEMGGRCLGIVVTLRRALEDFPL